MDSLSIGRNHQAGVARWMKQTVFDSFASCFIWLHFAPFCHARSVCVICFWIYNKYRFMTSKTGKFACNEHRQLYFKTSMSITFASLAAHQWLQVNKSLSQLKSRHQTLVRFVNILSILSTYVYWQNDRKHPGIIFCQYRSTLISVRVSSVKNCKVNITVLSGFQPC